MSDVIRHMLPTVTFRPSGQEAFMALMNLMVGTHVEITYVYRPVVLSPKNWHKGEIHYDVKSRRGEITYVNDDTIFLKPYGMPKRYAPTEYNDIVVDWSDVKMIEVIG